MDFIIMKMPPNHSQTQHKPFALMKEIHSYNENYISFTQ